MRTSVVRVGNSRGIRIPKPVLEQCRIGDEVDLSIKGKMIVLKAIQGKKKKPRDGWAESLREMHVAGHDKNMLPDHVAAEMEGWEW